MLVKISSHAKRLSASKDYSTLVCAFLPFTGVVVSFTTIRPSIGRNCQQQRRFSPEAFPSSFDSPHEIDIITPIHTTKYTPLSQDRHR